jgi:hypothetical protein
VRIDPSPIASSPVQVPEKPSIALRAETNRSAREKHKTQVLAFLRCTAAAPRPLLGSPARPWCICTSITRSAVDHDDFGIVGCSRTFGPQIRRYGRSNEKRLWRKAPLAPFLAHFSLPRILFCRTGIGLKALRVAAFERPTMRTGISRRTKLSRCRCFFRMKIGVLYKRLQNYRNRSDFSKDVP